MALGTGLIIGSTIISALLFGPDAYHSTFGAKKRRRRQGLADLIGRDKGFDMSTLLANAQDEADTLSAMSELRMGTSIRSGNLSLEGTLNDHAMHSQLADLISHDSRRQIGEVSSTASNDPAAIAARFGLM